MAAAGGSVSMQTFVGCLMISSYGFFDYAGPLLNGAWTTLRLFAAAEVVALLAGFLAGAGLISPWPWLRLPLRIYVEIFRGTSAVVLLFFLFFVLPQLGVSVEPFTIAVLGLGLNSGAYCAEFVRGALRGVPRGQLEAARAMGLTPSQVFRLVHLPIAIPMALPPLGSMSIDLLKLTSVASLITISELTFVAYQINQTTLDTMSLFGTVLVFYFVVAQLIALMFRLAERHFGRGMRLNGGRA